MLDNCSIYSDNHFRNHPMGYLFWNLNAFDNCWNLFIFIYYFVKIK